jgi:hypothetical protein
MYGDGDCNLLILSGTSSQRFSLITLILL